MNKELKKIISNIEGNIIGIGLDDKLEQELKDNKNIINCNFLSNDKKSDKKGFSLFSKKIKINKIRKKFKHKKIDYIICNYEVIDKYLNTFASDSIFINKKKIFFYGKLNKDKLLKYYQRFDVKIDIKKNIVEINVNNCEVNFIKRNYYRLKDFKDKMIDLIGNLLMN